VLLVPFLDFSFAPLFGSPQGRVKASADGCAIKVGYRLFGSHPFGFFGNRFFPFA
jgi:hypothetical protein